MIVRGRRASLLRLFCSLAVFPLVLIPWRSDVTLDAIQSEMLDYGIALPLFLRGPLTYETLQPHYEFDLDQMNDTLPTWLTDYIHWHREMRSKYPDNELITNPQAPKLYVRFCDGRCGGINDRLKYTPYDLLAASRMKRIYIIDWRSPAALENFLEPNLLNWTMPSTGMHLDHAAKGKGPVPRLPTGHVLSLV